MVWFILGIFAGGLVGVMCMALCMAASDADDKMENEYRKRGEK